MIIEIPTSNDFEESANDLLHSSWDKITELLIEFSEIGDLGDEEESDTSAHDQYWKAAKQTIITSYALVQQGVEFYIKSRITSISPFLLLTGSPSSWPKGCSKEDVVFSSFRTVDAQDLIKLHDTVCDSRLTDQFRQRYEKMRVSRNKIMHTIDKRISIKPEDLLEEILFSNQYFCGKNRWLESRFSYVDNTPAHSLRFIREDDGHKPYLLEQIYGEVGVVIEKLQPAKVKEYFGYEKRKKSYPCPSCYGVLSNLLHFDGDYFDGKFKAYQQVSDDKYSCRICGYSGKIITKQCECCENMKFDQEKNVCLYCGDYCG